MVQTWGDVRHTLDQRAHKLRRLGCPIWGSLPNDPEVARVAVEAAGAPAPEHRQDPPVRLHPPGSISSKLVLASGCRSRDLGVKTIN